MSTESQELDLNSIHEISDDVPAEPDDKTSQELLSLSAEGKRIELDLKRSELDAKKQDTDERKIYANKICNLIQYWLGCVIVVICLAAIGRKNEWFKIDNSVQIALITTTTASVVGLFAIVVNYLFKKK